MTPVIAAIDETMRAVMEASGTNYTPSPTRMEQEDIARAAILQVFKDQLDALDLDAILSGLKSRFGDRSTKEGRAKEEGIPPLSDDDIAFIEKLIKRTWQPDDKSFKTTVEEFFIGAINAAGSEALDTLKIDAVFDLTNKAAIKAVASHGAEMVKGVDDYSRELIKSAITQGLNKQSGTYDSIGKAIQAVFDGDIARSRANTIANTEVGNAMRAANAATYANNGVDLKSWLAEADACDLCLENEDIGAIALDDDFPNGMFPHPNCRCDVIPEPSPDWFPPDEPWAGGEGGDLMIGES